MEAARREGRAEAWADIEPQVHQLREQIPRALLEFDLRRKRYFEEVEREVVQLALSIARKILRRESTIDPWLLLGLVRVAIEQLEQATGVVVRVHPQSAAEWRNYFVLHLESERVPEVVEDQSVEPEGCRIETALGSALLGVETQMKEIETGLFDLMARRPDSPHD